MKTQKVLLLAAAIFFMADMPGFAQHTNKAHMKATDIVRAFLEVVRSGKSPERAGEFMTDTILAHQMNAENEETITRTPANYAGHIREFLRMYGNYQFEITELIGYEDKVYARWKQVGKQVDTIDQFPPTQLPLTEIGSAVYRVANGKICEYWIQLDREGFRLQLEENERTWKKMILAGPAKPGLPFSEAIPSDGSDGALYISGQVGTDPATGILVRASFAAEADQVMKNIGLVLQRHGLDYNDLLNVTIYLTDMDHYSETNRVYSRYFAGQFPARVCIAVKELPLKASIEISAVARLSNRQSKE